MNFQVCSWSLQVVFLGKLVILHTQVKCQGVCRTIDGMQTRLFLHLREDVELSIVDRTDSILDRTQDSLQTKSRKGKLGESKFQTRFSSISNEGISSIC